MTREEIDERIVNRSEKQLQEQVAQLLRLKGIVFNVSRMDRKTTGTVGWPDFTFAINGRACAFECKLPGNEPTATQTAILEAMKTNGWLIWIVHSQAEACFALKGFEESTQPTIHRHD